MSFRFVSQCINVPNLSNARSRDSVATEVEEDMEIDEKEQQAAVALCELSCSPPISLLFPASLPTKTVISPGSSLGSSAGCHEVQAYVVRSGVNNYSHTVLEPSSIDEGIEVEMRRNGFVMQSKKSASLTEIFQCTWPGCDWSCESAADIEKHIHRDHQCSDSEEELFYYTSKKVAVDDVTQAFTHLQASSPPQKIIASPRTATDHDYLLKAIRSSAPQTIPSRRPLHGPVHSSSYTNQPDQQSSVSPSSVSPQSRSWQYSSQNATSPTNMLSASPGHKRSRSDVKKCRKVYGMERREEWCTQCKWKKACTRFID